MTIQLVLIAVLFAGALVKSGELVSRPQEPRLCALLLTCLALLGVGLALSMPAVTQAVDAAVATGAGKIVYNAATMAGLYTLLRFFFVAINGPAAARRVRVDALVLAAVVTCLIVLMILTPANYRAHTLSAPYIAYPTVGLFYLVGGAYFIYAQSTAAVLIWRFARSSGGALALALRVIFLGLVGLTLTSTIRAVWVGIRFAGGPPLEWLNSINFPTSLTAYLLVTVGLCGLGLTVAVLSLRSWITDRRRYHQLEPLWSVISQTYPELVLPPDTPRRRFMRRLIECRDGLARLAPYIGAAGNGNIDGSSPAHLANLVLTATTLQREGVPRPAATAGVATATHTAAADPFGDVDMLIAISQALPTARG